MTPQARLRRIGWFTALFIFTALYGVLHFQVWTISSDVKMAERVIVNLEDGNSLLETEFQTRSRQVQLAAWNRVDFGYTAPAADQFIENERELSRFGGPRADNAPAPIRLAGQMSDEETPAFPTLVSPLTGRKLDVALVEPTGPSGSSGSNGANGSADRSTTELAARIVSQTVRIPLNARAAAGPVVSVAFGDAGQ